MNLNSKLQAIEGQLEGEFYYDTVLRTLYATDASAYREHPIAVALPKNNTDIEKLISFANENEVTLIPRAAGQQEKEMLVKTRHHYRGQVTY